LNHKVTREKLYKQVWREPLSKLCSKYDISDVGLKKVLDRHGIPRPPVGYWAMKPQNQQKHLRPLPELATGQSEDIVFEGFSQNKPTNLANHALVIKANTFEPVQSRRLPGELNRIFSELRSQQTDKYGVVKSTGVRIAKKRHAEAKQALGHLQQLTMLLGWQLHVSNGIKLSSEDSSYRVELNERVERSDNPKYGKYQESGNYRDWAEKWLYTPTGELTLSFDNKKFRITDGVIEGCGKIVEHVLKSDQLRLAAAQEQRRQEEERKALRQLDGREKLKDKLQAYTAELFLAASEQHRKWIDAQGYLSHLKTQDMSCLGESTHLLEDAVRGVEPPNPEELREKLNEKEAELEAEYQKYVEDGWWPRQVSSFG
jgi:hypothetical protein